MRSGERAQKADWRDRKEMFGIGRYISIVREMENHLELNKNKQILEIEEMMCKQKNVETRLNST